MIGIGVAMRRILLVSTLALAFLLAGCSQSGMMNEAETASETEIESSMVEVETMTDTESYGILN